MELWLGKYTVIYNYKRRVESVNIVLIRFIVLYYVIICRYNTYIEGIFYVSLQL